MGKTQLLASESQQPLLFHSWSGYGFIQVSDLVSSKGPNTLGLMGDTKKDLVFALQEATIMDYSQSWMGAKIAELAEQLGNAWSSGTSTVSS